MSDQLWFILGGLVGIFIILGVVGLSEADEKARNEKWDTCVALQKVSNTPYEVFIKDCLDK